ncbi:MAG TPA: DinB family protein [Anaerolineales bacterium]|nr:DinB family protein [Anaerolineales bacterium]
MPITALLFDLDDTLLGNDINRFVPAYLQRFSAHLAGVIPPQTFVSSLMAGAQAMLRNDDPRCTLEDVFNEVFYRSVNVSLEQARPHIDSFYAQGFPALRSETAQILAARETMTWAFDSGLKVAIATNALFPRTAILQRLDWAGVSADEFPYALIATLEFMHFAKPKPEYFAEMLAWLDCRPEEVMMIGNEWPNDIAPPATMGIHTYWIAAPGSPPPENHAHPVGTGTLADFLNWARTPGNLASLSPLPATPRSARAQQAASLATMLELTKNVSPKNWRRHPREGEWSLTEIAGHLRDVEIEVNLPRLKTILDESNPFISAVESDPWAVTRDYQSQSGIAALAAFADARRETITLLDRLTPDEWQRPARHAIFGPTHLQELVAFTSEHDRLHLRQMRENIRAFGL